MLIIGGSVAALALTGVLAWTRFAPAQPPGQPPATGPGETMTINIPEVEVRSGPSNSFYVTNKLRAGEQVSVISKTDQPTPGWLAIKPPRGSISYVSTRFLRLDKNTPNQGIVQSAEPVDVMPANMIPGQESNVSKAKVTTGTVVLIRGPIQSLPDGSGLVPIEPPDAELRYIPDSAVARSSVQPAGGTTGFFTPPGGDQSLLAQADSKRLEAIRLYQQAAQSSDPNQRAQAQCWLAAMQQSPGAPVASQPAFPFSTTSSGSAKGPGVALGGSGIPGQPAAAASTAMYASPTATSAPQWSKWGTLRKTAYQLKDGHVMFRLEDRDGSSLGYAVAAPGLTLEPYVGQYVCLYGVTAYRSDDTSMRTHYVIVSQLARP
jgi:hypothetical protein